VTTSLHRLDPSSPTMTVEVAAEYLGISRTVAYSEAQRYRDTGGRAGLPNIKLGGRVLVLTALVSELIGRSVSGDAQARRVDRPRRARRRRARH